MSESRNSGESRNSRYASSYIPTPSESGNRSSYPSYNLSQKNINNTESRNGSSKPAESPKYNNLEDIDSLIEKLEREMSNITSSSPRINQALEQRKRKMEELKRLRNEVKRLREEEKRKEEEEKQLKLLEQSNAELDDVISGVKKLIKKPNETIDSYIYDPPYCNPSESHDSGESRW